MGTAMTVGDFSRVTHLSVKTLRHYHQVGLLEPAQVDPDNGYRYYQPAQIPAAQVIRRLRDLGMPVAEVKAVLYADDLDSRNTVIAAHLDRPFKQPEKHNEPVRQSGAGSVCIPAWTISIRSSRPAAVTAVRARST